MKVLIFFSILFSCTHLAVALDNSSINSVVTIIANDVETGEDYNCLGTVISKNMIATAAHCIENEIHFLQTHLVKIKNIHFFASNVKVHPLYKKTQNSSYDVAILIFENADFRQLVQVVPLATSLEMKGLVSSKQVVMGRSNDAGKQDQLILVVNKVNQYFFSTNNVQSHPVPGDSGAPVFMFIPEKNAYRQVGLHLFNVYSTQNGQYRESDFVRIERLWELLDPAFFFY